MLNKNRKASIVLGLGLLTASVATVGIAGAQDTVIETGGPSMVEPLSFEDFDSTQKAIQDEIDALGASSQGEIGDWEPTEEEITELNATIQKEIDALTAAGVTFTIETDDFGIRFPIWDEDQNEAAFDAIGALYGSPAGSLGGAIDLGDLDFDDDFDDFDDFNDEDLPDGITIAFSR